jgi:hypothetical protein
MLNSHRIVRAFKLGALVCLLCIPYTDLRVEREPRALGDHQVAAGLQNDNAPVLPAVAQLEAEMAATPLQAILRNLSDEGLNIYYLRMTRLLNLNPEVFGVLVDKLPMLAETADLDRLLRSQLKDEFQKSFKLYGPKPQELLAKSALQILIERLDKAERDRLLAAEPDLQKQLIEQLLRERLMQMNQPLMAQNGGYTRGADRGTMGDAAGVAPQAAPVSDRRMGDLARMLNAPKNDSASPGAAKAAETNKPSAKPFKLPADDDKPTTTAKANPPKAAAQTQPRQQPVAEKKSALPAIQNTTEYAGVGSGQSPSGAGNGVMPIQAGLGNASSEGGGSFAFDVNGGAYGPPVRQKFNFQRANPYLSSNGEGESVVAEGESEIAASGYSVFSTASSALGAAKSPIPVSSGPAFSKPMELTLSGLCASGALNCGNR